MTPDGHKHKRPFQSSKRWYTAVFGHFCVFVCIYHVDPCPLCECLRPSSFPESRGTASRPSSSLLHPDTKTQSVGALTNVLYLFISLITFTTFRLVFYNTFKTQPHDGSRQLIDTVSWKAYRMLPFIYIWHLAYFMIDELSLRSFLVWKQIYKQHLESPFFPPFIGCNWLRVLVDLVLTLATGPKQMFRCISCLSSCAFFLIPANGCHLRLHLLHSGRAALRSAALRWISPMMQRHRAEFCSCSHGEDRADRSTGVGCSREEPAAFPAEYAAQLHKCPCCTYTPSVCACQEKKKNSDSPCSDGGAGQSHRIHTSETHAKRVIMLNNWRRFHILKTTFTWDSGASDLNVKSLHKCGRSLVSHTRPAVEKPLLIVLYHPRGFNLHARGLSSPSPCKNSQWTPSEAVDSFAYWWSRKWSTWAIQPVKPHFISPQICSAVYSVDATERLQLFKLQDGFAALPS